MTTRITLPPDVQRFLENSVASAVVVNANGDTTHLVLPIDEARQMFHEYIKREVEVGCREADRGEVVDWDIDATLQEARRRSGLN